MPNLIANLFQPARPAHDLPAEIAHRIDGAAHAAAGLATEAGRIVRRRTRASAVALRRDPVPALVVLVGAICAARLLRAHRH